MGPAPELIDPYPGAMSDPVPGPRLVTAVENIVMVVLAVGLLSVAGAVLVTIWRGIGVELRPDGLVDRNPFGKVAFPWDALAPGTRSPARGRQRGSP